MTQTTFRYEQDGKEYEQLSRLDYLPNKGEVLMLIFENTSLPVCWTVKHRIFSNITNTITIILEKF